MVLWFFRWLSILGVNLVGDWVCWLVPVSLSDSQQGDIKQSVHFFLSSEIYVAAIVCAELVRFESKPSTIL